MSGHSKWKKIKRQKMAGDVKKGMTFTKLGYAITLAAKEGGGNPDMNFMLRMAIDKAKEANMPKDTIERAIKKGTGELAGEALETISYEVVGKDGVGIIIKCITDNTNRTVTEVRNLASKSGFNMTSGSIGWQFEAKGRILIEPLKKKESEKYSAKGTVEYEKLDIEELILEIMEVPGVEDVSKTEEGSIEVVTERNQFAEISNIIEERGYKIQEAGIAHLAKNKVQVEDEYKEKVRAFIEELEELDDVDKAWTNIK